MDFHALVAKLNQLDKQPVEVQTQENCGSMPVPPMPEKTETPPPSLSVNLNAQGMDNIEQMMQLFKKVNPDMMPKDPTPMPTLSMEPGIASITPSSLPPLKMLPDFDADNDDKVGGELDSRDLDKDSDDIMMKMDASKDTEDEGDQPAGLAQSLDRDGDGDHDMDDHKMEPEDDEEKKEEWANQPDVENKDIDYIVNKVAGGMNKGHDTYPKVADGDNPMQRVKESEDLKSEIKAELRRRLEEARGAK